MKRFVIKQNIINKYLPKNDHYFNDLIVYYDPKILQFRCNNCGQCCDMKLQGKASDAFVVVLSDLDVKNLYKTKKTNYLQKKFPNVTNLITSVDTDVLQETGEEVAFVRKIDGSCVFFNQENHNCEIYTNRPLSCQIYPFSAVKKKEDAFNYIFFIDYENVPCSRECFEGSHFSEKDLMKFFIRHIVLIKRQKLGRKPAKKLNRKVMRSLKHEEEKFSKNLEPIINQIEYNEPDLIDHYSLTCKNSEKLLIRTWTYCTKEKKILNKICKVLNDSKEKHAKNPPEMISSFLSPSIGVSIIINYFYHQKKVVGIMIMMRRRDSSDFINFNELTAKDIIYLMGLEGSSEIPKYYQEYLDKMAFDTWTVNLPT